MCVFIRTVSTYMYLYVCLLILHLPACVYGCSFLHTPSLPPSLPPSLLSSPSSSEGLPTHIGHNANRRGSVLSLTPGGISVSIVWWLLSVRWARFETMDPLVRLYGPVNRVTRSWRRPWTNWTTTWMGLRSLQRWTWRMFISLFISLFISVYCCGGSECFCW